MLLAQCCGTAGSRTAPAQGKGTLSSMLLLGPASDGAKEGIVCDREKLLISNPVTPPAETACSPTRDTRRSLINPGFQGPGESHQERRALCRTAILHAISQFLQGIIKRFIIQSVCQIDFAGYCTTSPSLPLWFGLPPPQIQPGPYTSMNREIISAAALPVGSSGSFSFSLSFIYLATKAVLQCTHAETHYLCFCLQKTLGVPWTHSKPLPL